MGLAEGIIDDACLVIFQKQEINELQYFFAEFGSANGVATVASSTLESEQCIIGKLFID